MNRYLLLCFIVFVIFGCKNTKSTEIISFWGSFYSKGDMLELSLNGKEIRRMSFRENYFFPREKPLYILKKYHYVGDTTRIDVTINKNDTTFFVNNKTIKTIIIGRDIYGGIMIDYVFSDGGRTFIME